MMVEIAFVPSLDTGSGRHAFQQYPTLSPNHDGLDGKHLKVSELRPRVHNSCTLMFSASSA